MKPEIVVDVENLPAGMREEFLKGFERKFDNSKMSFSPTSVFDIRLLTENERKALAVADAMSSPSPFKPQTFGNSIERIQDLANGEVPVGMPTPLLFSDRMAIRDVLNLLDLARKTLAQIAEMPGPAHQPAKAVLRDMRGEQKVDRMVSVTVAKECDQCGGGAAVLVTSGEPSDESMKVMRQCLGGGTCYRVAKTVQAIVDGEPVEAKGLSQ